MNGLWSPDDSTDHCVYALYDANGVCFYVGRTRQLAVRLSAHRRRFGARLHRHEILASGLRYHEACDHERFVIFTRRPYGNCYGSLRPPRRGQYREQPAFEQWLAGGAA